MEAPQSGQPELVTVSESDPDAKQRVISTEVSRFVEVVWKPRVSSFTRLQ
jgi:hypothetical protein